MIDQTSFRRCLGKFATGVTVVTCSDKDGRPCGITANSFSSVSLEPPLILWNIAKVSRSLGAFLEASHFAINILSSRQRDLSHHFAMTDHTLFDGVTYTLSENNVPLLPDTLACLQCRTQKTYDAGDHHIIIGEVCSSTSTDLEPLIFFGGDYSSLS